MVCLIGRPYLSCATFLSLLVAGVLFQLNIGYNGRHMPSLLLTLLAVYAAFFAVVHWLVSRED